MAMNDRTDWAISQAAAMASDALATVALVSAQEKEHEAREGRKKRSSPPYDVIRIVNTENGKAVKARLDDGYPQFFGGYGGWEDEARPGQVSATVFRGANAPKLKLRLILGGWPRRLADGRRRVERPHRSREDSFSDNCDRDMRMLDHFARLAWDDHRSERPPLVRIRGQVPHHHRLWFIENLEWGDVDVYRNARIRAFVTVTLRMYVPVTILKRRDRVARPTKTHVVKRNETLSGIVQEELDVRGANVALARKYVLRMNGLKQGVRLEPRQRIKLPVGNWWIKAAKQRGAARGKPRSPNRGRRGRGR